DNLRKKQLWIPAECFSSIVDKVACAGSGEKKHGHKLLAEGRASLAHEKESVEDDRFGKGDGQNRLHQDGSSCAGIAAHGGGRAHADETDADGRAEGGQADVNAAAYFCK